MMRHRLLLLLALLILPGCEWHKNRIKVSPQTASDTAAVERSKGLRPQICGQLDGEGGPYKPLSYNTREDTPKRVHMIRSHNCRWAAYCQEETPPYCPK